MYRLDRFNTALSTNSKLNPNKEQKTETNIYIYIIEYIKLTILKLVKESQ